VAAAAAQQAADLAKWAALVSQDDVKALAVHVSDHRAHPEMSPDLKHKGTMTCFFSCPAFQI